MYMTLNRTMCYSRTIVGIPLFVEEPFREETIDRFGGMKKVVTSVSVVFFSVLISVFV